VHDLTTYARSQQESNRSRQPKKEKMYRKQLKILTAATKPIHEPRIQAKSQIVRIVILTADRSARVQSKERIAVIQKMWWWFVVEVG
jgi:hypothetical protein